MTHSLFEGAFIKKLREERKMTQANLAEKLFVSEKTVSKWETGKAENQKNRKDILLLQQTWLVFDFNKIIPKKSTMEASAVHSGFKIILMFLYAF